ncbi:MAG: penicillin-binding protein 2 [Planctomycetota bacterium]
MKRSRRLVVLAFVLVTLALAALEARVFYLQVLEGDELARRLSPYHLRELGLPAPRGQILDRHGELIAVSVPAWDVEVYRPAVSKPKLLAARLSECLPVSQEEVAPCAPDGNQPRVKILAKGLQDDAIIWRLQQMKEKRLLPGVTLRKRFLRRYPQRELGGMLVGFVNYAGEGVSGLEAAYDGLLAGESGSRSLRHDAKDIEIADERCEEIAPRPGGDIVLTIDMRLQHLAAEALRVLRETYRADRAVAIVTHPRSGELLALVQFPSVDPEDLESSRPRDWRNIAVEDYDAPGSIFKAFSMAMALEKGVVRLAESIDCENGSYRIPGRVIRDVQALGRVPLEDVIVHSSNVGMTKVFLRLVPEGTPKGSELFRYPYQTLLNLGFGRKTALGLPHESPGKLTDLEEWSRNYTLASVAFGYEVGTSALQLAQAFGVFPNEGILVPLRLVREIRLPGEKPRAIETAPPGRVFSRETAATVTRMLRRVVEEGTGESCRIPGVAVAAKSGSSVPPGREDQPCTKTALFVAFAPVEEPQLLVLVVAQKDATTGKFRGGTVAAPAVRMILEGGLAVLNVSKTERCDDLPAGGRHAGF